VLSTFLRSLAKLSSVELSSLIDQDQALELFMGVCVCVCVFLIAPIILLRPANRTPPPPQLGYFAVSR
jgi:hypothetical protein